MDNDVREACLATDLLRIALDPMTKRLMSLGPLQTGVWAAHLIDLTLLVAIKDETDTAVFVKSPSPMHPLVDQAARNLRPNLPRSWHLCFAPDVFHPQQELRRAVNWLVSSGTWKRHHLSNGPFFWRPQFTELLPGYSSRTKLLERGEPDLERLRAESLTCLASASTVTAPPGRDTVHAPSSSFEAQARAVNSILRAMRKAASSNQLNNPVMPGL
jgi:hypothetical protein